jgi:hypothetical protein
VQQDNGRLAQRFCRREAAAEIRVHDDEIRPAIPRQRCDIVAH